MWIRAHDGALVNLAKMAGVCVDMTSSGHYAVIAYYYEGQSQLSPACEKDDAIAYLAEIGRKIPDEQLIIGSWEVRNA